MPKRKPFDPGFILPPELSALMPLKRQLIAGVGGYRPRVGFGRGSPVPLSAYDHVAVCGPCIVALGSPKQRAKVKIRPYKKVYLPAICLVCLRGIATTYDTPNQIRNALKVIREEGYTASKPECYALLMAMRFCIHLMDGRSQRKLLLQIAQVAAPDVPWGMLI